MEIEKLIIGSANPGKIKDWLSLIHGVRLESIDSSLPKPDEVGSTFEENAAIKAIHYSLLLRQFVLADDAGFEVDALGGLPGVKSRRILPGDKEGTDQQCIDYIMQEMVDIPETQRTARKVSVAAIASPKGQVIFSTRASVDGYVSDTPSTILLKGYPYMSALIIPAFNKYYSELSPQEYAEAGIRNRMAERINQFLADYVRH